MVLAINKSLRKNRNQKDKKALRDPKKIRRK